MTAARAGGRRRRPRWRVLTWFALAAAAPAWPQSVPPVLAADLLRSCTALVNYAEKGGPITVDATSCAAYLKGLRDGVDATPVRSPSDRAFCASGAALDDLARSVVKYLQEQPDGGRRHAATEALAALARAYPCARK